MPANPQSPRRQRLDNAPADVNLVPFMGIMIILVPMLLYMFSFHIIRVQQVAAPRRGNGVSVDNKPKPLNLTVQIRQNQGFVLSWDEALLPDRQRLPILPMVAVDDPACAAQGCERRTDACYCYDYPGLYTVLVKMKARGLDDERPDRRINIAADLEVPWSVVSRVIDASNCILEAPEYSDFAAYSEAKPLAGELVRVPGTDDPVQLCKELFPRVVFAMTD